MLIPAGTTSCESYAELIRRDEPVGSAVFSANHLIVNSYPGDMAEELLTPQEYALSVAKGMAKRDIAYSLIEGGFESPDTVYWGLVATVEKICAGQCETCPLREANTNPRS